MPYSTSMAAISTTAYRACEVYLMDTPEVDINLFISEMVLLSVQALVVQRLQAQSATLALMIPGPDGQSITGQLHEFFEWAENTGSKGFDQSDVREAGLTYFEQATMGGITQLLDALANAGCLTKSHNRYDRDLYCN